MPVAGMTTNEQRKLVQLYLGVTGGYLAGFDNISLLERFYIGAGLDVNPRELQGTNREKFEQILASASSADQAVIIRASLARHPPDESAWGTRTNKLHDELSSVADRLEGLPPVASKKPVITTLVVSRAIDDAEELIKATGATSAVDRLHTVLHGYLQAVCTSAGINYAEKTMMSGLFALIRYQHPAFAGSTTRKAELDSIARHISGIMDILNPIRNQASLAHPNKDLLEAPEAFFVVNIVRTILNYLDSKLSPVSA